MKTAKKVAVYKSGIIEADLYTASFIYVNIPPQSGFGFVYNNWLLNKFAVFKKK